MDDALTLHRWQFAFTASYHYIFPQLSMGLALLLVIFKTLALRGGDEAYNECARFWSRVFGATFAMGVVTGIPLEFQFGTNWAAFAKSAGGVIGQTLAMEGIFAFFLESSFLGLFLYGEKKLGPRLHWLCAFLLFLGAWLSGYFIICTNAWMQHPVGHELAADGRFHLASLAALLTNPWAFWQYLHNMCGSVITACFTVASIGAYYVLSGRHTGHGRRFLNVAIPVGALATILQVFPTGDSQGRMVALHQPATLAAMEGLFETEKGAALAIIGQPNMQTRRLDNPIMIPRALSFLTYRRWRAEVRGLDAFPETDWPDNIPLLFYSYHIMVGLGTIFVAIMLLAAWKLHRGTLTSNRPLLWTLLLALPFPFIANTAGWMTAELGRQPWLIYGLMRTDHGASPLISSGNALFTLLGFMGMYLALGVLFVFIVCREIAHGPTTTDRAAPHPQPAAARS